MLHFFYPAACHEKRPKKLKRKPHESTKLNDKLRNSDINSILLHEHIPKTRFMNALVEEYYSSVGFYYVSLNDARFDILTPKCKIFADYNISVEVDLFVYVFVVFNPKNQNKKVAFEYNPNIIPLLECLETGVLTKEFCEVSYKLRDNEHFFENGSLICKYCDFRFGANKTVMIKLDSDSSLIINYLKKSASDADLLKQEKRMLLQKNPLICTDPSPNVARVKAIVDFRKKMWIKQSKRNNDFIRNKVQRIPPKENTVGPYRIMLKRANVEFPIHLKTMISQLNYSQIQA